MGAEHSHDSDQGGGFAAMCCTSSGKERRRAVHDEWRSRQGPLDDEVRSVEGLSKLRAQQNWGYVERRSAAADHCEWGCVDGETASSAEERAGAPVGLEASRDIQPRQEEQRAAASLPLLKPLSHKSPGARRGMSRPNSAKKEFEEAERFYRKQHEDLKSSWMNPNQKDTFFKLRDQISEEEKRIVRAQTLQRSNQHYLKQGVPVVDTMKQPYAWSDRIYNTKAPAKPDAMNVGTVRNMGTGAKKYGLHEQRALHVQENGVAILTSEMTESELKERARMVRLREAAAKREREAAEKETEVFYRKNKPDSPAKAKGAAAKTH